jgi:hypothetical protein
VRGFFVWSEQKLVLQGDEQKKTVFAEGK